MKQLNINLRNARSLCCAITYANEQVNTSSIPVYTKDTDSDETYQLNQSRNEDMCCVRHRLLDMFSDSISVEVRPSCISSNREASYIFEARRNYMFGKLSSKIEVVYEDDDSAKLVYHR